MTPFSIERSNQCSSQIVARCDFFALARGSKIVVNVEVIPRGVSDEGGSQMKRILAVAGGTALALILMDTYQVVKATLGLTVAGAGQALAADLGPPPPPPPPPAPIGKGKAPYGKAPYGKGKAPPPVVTKG
jgi:hypothetical protein